MAPITLLRFFAATGLFAVLIANISAVQDSAPIQSDNRPPSATEVVVREGRLSIRAENESLVALLSAVARHASLSITVAPELDADRVSIAFADMPIDEGLRRILREYDAFFYHSGALGTPAEVPAEAETHRLTAPPLTVWVFPRGSGRGLAPLSASAWVNDADLEAHLTAPNPGTRVRAIEALIERRGDEATSAVLMMLADDDDSVRARTLELAFGGGLEVPSDRVFDLALNDRSAVVRLQALQIASERPGPEAAAVAESAQHDPDPHVRIEAKAMLARLAARAAISSGAARPPQP
jgi:hypothetical protein